MIGVFLDRDGTIGGDGGGVNPLEFILYDFSAKAIKLLNDKGIKVFLFTNQSWIGMGKFTEATFLEGCKIMNNILEEHNAFLDDIYYCPHKPDEKCECRKPKPFLLKKARDEYDLDLSKCYVVGDRLSDMISAENIGAAKVLVKTGRGKKSFRELSNTYSEKLMIDYVAYNVLDATEWILKDINVSGK